MASLVTTTVAGTVTINASGMGMTFTTPSTGQNSWITWKDGGTTNKWEIGKNTANKLYIHNYAASATALEFDSSSHAVFGGNITLNSANSTIASTGNLYLGTDGNDDVLLLQDALATFSTALTYAHLLKGGSASNAWNPTVGMVYDAGVSTSYNLISVGNTTNGEMFNVAGSGNTTIGGNLTVNGSQLYFYRAVNSGNPELHIGSSATNQLVIQSVYTGSAQTLNYVSFKTFSSLTSANAGQMAFYVDESDAKLTIHDTGITMGGSVSADTDDSYNLGSDSFRFKNLYLRSDCIIGTDATVGGNLDVTGGLVVDGASTLGDGSDTTHVKGSIIVDTNVYGPSLGAVAVAAGLNVTGAGSFTGALTIGAYTLPNTDGTSGYHLQTNGSGAVTWQPGGAGTVTSVTAGTGMTQTGTSTVNPTLNVIGGTGITANANDIAITNTAVTAGSYTYAAITVDAQGRLTAASSGTAPGGGTVTGSGTDNYIPRWNGTTALHNSIMYDSGASVGISSVAFTSPAGTLHTQAGGSNITYLDAYSTTNGTGSLLNFRKSDSATIGTKTQTDSGDSLGTMGFYGVHTGSDWGLGASINVSQEGVSGTAYVPAHMAFATCTASAYGERMRITNDGNVGIGTTAPGSLLTISGNSDDGDEASALRIIDEDSTGGSKLPAIMFYGGSTMQGRIRGGDSTFGIAVGSTPTTALSINTGTQAATFSGSVTVEGDDTDVENLYVNQEAIFDGHAYPYADSSYTLGTNALRWSTIYGDAGNFSGALTGTSVDLTGDITMKSGYSTSSKIRFGLSSWGNNIGLESYWTVHSTNRNEGYIFKDTDDVELLRMHGSNNGTTPQRATFSGALTVSGTATSAFAGSVGIGTTNPSVGLEVAKTSADASFKVNRTDQTNIQLIAAGNSYVRASAALILQSNGANNRLTLATDGAATFSGTLTVNDNININKADGFIYLNSAGTGNSGCYVRGLSGGAMRFQSQFYYDWEVTGNFKMRLTADGKLGIGTTAPGTYTSVAANLEVKTSGHGGIAINAGAASLGMLAFVQNGTHKWSLECQNNATPYISFNEAGTQRLTIANGGKVGIGTTVPEGRVDVQMSMSGVDWTYGNWGEVWDSASNPGSKFNDCVFHIDTNRGGGVTGGIVGLAFSPGWQGHQNWGIYSTNESGGGYTQGDLRFVNQLNNATITERVTFKADGKVGIGTYSPATKLEVRSGDVRLTDAHVIEWGGTKARIGGSNSGDYLRFYTDDAVRICVISDGKVGINDTTPGYQLDVNGTFRVTGAATFDSAAYLNSTGTGIRGAYWTSTSTAVGSLYGNRIENMYTPNYLEKLLAYKVPTKFEVSNSSGSSFSDTTVTDAVAGIFNEGWYPANQYTWAQSSNKKIRFSFTTFGYRFVTCMAMRATTSSNTVTMMVEKSSSADFSSGVVTVFTSTGMNGWPGFWQIVNTWHNSGNSAAMRITLESNQANSTNITLNNIDCTGGYSFGSGGRILTGYSKTTGREGILHGRLGINASPSGYYLYVNGTSLFKDGVEMDDTLELDGNFTWSGYQYFTHSTARILANTADGSDTKVLYLGGGGDAGQGRGAYIGLHGNDTASTPGSLYLLSGNDGDVRMYSGGAERVTINNNGSIQYNGDTQQSWIQFKDAGTLSGYIGSGIGLAASPNNLNTDFAIRAKTKLALCTNDSNAAKVTILADGNVGIDSTNPSKLLYVNGTSAFIGTSYFNSYVDINSYLHLQGAGSRLYMYGVDNWIQHDGGGFDIFGNNTQLMYWKDDGKVGIGTNAPDRLLHLYAGASGQATPTTSAMLVLEDDASGNYISFLNPNNATAGFFWGDPQDSARAQLIYSHADNKMTFNAGGAVHMTIQSDGNVGIGTTSPAAKLEVALGAYSNVKRVLILNNTNTAAYGGASYDSVVINQEDVPCIRLRETPNNVELTLACGNEYSNSATIGTTGMLRFATARSAGQTGYSTSGTRMVILADGKVGIGITNPTARLYVVETANNAWALQVKGTGTSANYGLEVNCTAGAAASSQPFKVESPSGGPFFIDGNGNVGIGDGSPTYKLDVNGTGRFTGALTASSFSGNGASISALNALNISSGTVGTARLGSGTANSSVFLRGDNTWATPANTTYTAGTGLTMPTGTSFATKLDELTDMTADVVGSQDELILLDNGSDRRKQINEIKLGQFNNDQGWASGDITSVGAALGLSGGGTSGAVSLALDLNELVDSNKIAAGDKVAFVDVNASSQSAICEVSDIPLSVFDNDSGWITSNWQALPNISSLTALP